MQLAFEPVFLDVELVLDLVEDVVADFTFATQVDERAALGGDGETGEAADADDVVPLSVAPAEVAWRVRPRKMSACSW